jgi:hypothetical protein
MYEKETLKDAVLFLMNISKTDIDPAELVAILYIADIYHLILFGRTIIDSIKDTKYMLMDTDDMRDLCNELKGKTSNYNCLSETDKDALEFAKSRREIYYFQDIPMCFGLRHS